jgi:hypothetical protein
VYAQRPVTGPRNRVLAATALLRLELRQRAQQVFDDAVRSNPRDKGRLWFEAAYLARTGDEAAATNRLREYVRSFPATYLQTVQSRVFEKLQGRSDYPRGAPAVHGQATRGAQMR